MSDSTTPADRWQRVKDIFGAALELPAAAREEYLRAACGNDDGLRREVEMLLKGQSAARLRAEPVDLNLAFAPEPWILTAVSTMISISV